MSGAPTVLWDGRDDAGNPIASGVSIARLRVGERVAAHRMTLGKIRENGLWEIAVRVGRNTPAPR